MRVTLTNLTQEAVLETMRDALQNEIKNDPDQKKSMKQLLPDIDAFKARIDFYIRRLKPEFFNDWGDKAKGFDGSKAVKDEYKEAVALVIGGDRSIDSLKKSGSNQHLLYQD